jgi:hypothetical protein
VAERWRRELKRLRELRPGDELFDRARHGSTSTGSAPRLVSRALTIIVAFAVFAAGGVLLWRGFMPGSADATRVWQRGYRSPPGTGYYILLPDQGEQVANFNVRVTALTNLPDGTLLDISTTNEGTCCPPVADSKISFTEQDSACYGFVGQPPSGAAFDVTITTRPDFGPWVIPGPVQASKPPQQPESVLRILGQRFQNLSGDQVRVQDDGSKWLVSKGTVPWPEPRCGGDPIPLFGGPECLPDEYEQQLQSDDLAGAMVEVMGAIRQGRMCEFWSVMLPPNVEAQHPWPEFSAEWREWLLLQDFSSAEPIGDGSTGRLRWESVGDEGHRSIVDVIHDGRRIATLELQPLPDYCQDCGPNVVPFWGVTSWQLYASRP